MRSCANRSKNECSRRVQRVDELLEADHLSVFEGPYVDGLRVHGAAGVFVRAVVAAQRDDAIVAIDQIIHRDRETVPFADTACEHAGRNQCLSAFAFFCMSVCALLLTKRTECPRIGATDAQRDLGTFGRCCVLSRL